jgi:hypothetical protein
MARDPIVEEIHKTREEIAKRFGNDLRAIAADARKRQGQHGHPVVKTAPRPATNKPLDDTAA